MTPPTDPERSKNHRFPSEIISHGVWLYYRFTLSYRDGEELLMVSEVRAGVCQSPASPSPTAGG